MDPALREVIEFYVGEGYDLTSLTPQGRATLVRGGERVRLHLADHWVLLDEAPPAPAATPAPRAEGERRSLAGLFAVLATLATAALVVIAAALLLDRDGGGSSNTVASPSTDTPTATAPPSSTATATPVETAPPDTPTPVATPTAAPTAVPPAARLLAADQVLGPGSTAIRVDEAGAPAPFFVVVYRTRDGAIGAPLAASGLLVPGTHHNITVPLPAPLTEDVELWLVLHLDGNGNRRFDGAPLDPAVTDGGGGPAGEVAARIAVRSGAPAPPPAGNGGQAAETRGPTVLGVALALGAAALLGLLARRRSRRG